MDRQQIKIPNADNSAWINLLKSSNIELDDTNNYFTSQYLEEAMIELYERFMLIVTNKETSDMIKGQPVFIDDNNYIYFADASHSVRYNVAGFIFSDVITPDNTGLLKTEGIITNTKAQWDLIDDNTSSNGLEDGASYFLSHREPGKITTTAPETGGMYVVPIGRALTKTHFKIDIDPAIGL